MRVGLVINPVAGMGGSVGLKGTDGPDAVSQALSLGAVPLAESRVVRALRMLNSLRDSIEWIAPKGPMGGDALAAANQTTVKLITELEPSAEATQHSAQAMVDDGVDLIVFAGGDGTARDIASVVGWKIPVLGVPCGVKMHSGVFAITPEAAGRLLANLVKAAPRATEYRHAEIMDIDEAALRNGHLNARLYGYVNVPHMRRLIQNAKATPQVQDETLLDMLGHEVAGELQPDVTYLVGPGTTAKRPLDALGLPSELLGLDVLRDGEILASDATSAQALTVAGEGPLHIICGVTGGQGFVFGRGNQQIGPEAIDRCWPDCVTILASAEKLAALAPPELVVDTGDPALDSRLRGYTRVRTAPRRSMMMRLI
ncbi:MAG: ATP-NAD kinase family protein [Hyphomicrobiales bacterium]|nr:ATP-NAD kinase family protein [Hyphomicrobiales bacterium]MCP4998777.1 ATP-NAD kinase family protein [Hyphomicrobiales bacterium]